MDVVLRKVGTCSDPNGSNKCYELAFSEGSFGPLENTVQIVRDVKHRLTWPRLEIRTARRHSLVLST